MIRQLSLVNARNLGSALIPESMGYSVSLTIPSLNYAPPPPWERSRTV